HGSSRAAECAAHGEGPVIKRWRASAVGTLRIGGTTLLSDHSGRCPHKRRGNTGNNGAARACVSWVKHAHWRPTFVPRDKRRLVHLRDLGRDHEFVWQKYPDQHAATGGDFGQISPGKIVPAGR